MTPVMRFPISCTSSIALSFREPPVSMETGKKMCEFSKVLYLAHLLITARSAAAPACMAVSCMCESAYVSGTITSQAKGLPLSQGIKVASSGRLPSCMSPKGSLTAGISARFTALQIRSFI